MLRNYMLVALRALRRQPAYALVNVFGLAIGLAFCTLIALFIADEVSYDRFHEAPEQVYRLHRVPADPDFIFGPSVNLPYPLGPALVADFEEIEAFARFQQAPPVLVFHDGQTFEEAKYAYADGDVFDVFTFPFVQGNPDTALREPLSIVLTAPMARRYFGEADPLDQTLQIRLFDRPLDFRVTGVTEAVPSNSTLQFDFLLSMETQFQVGLNSRERAANWGNSSPLTYVRLVEGADIERVRAQMPGFMETHVGRMFAMARERGFWDRPEQPFLFRFQPLLDIHLNPDVPGGFTPPSSPTRSILLGAMALAILLIACINFMTLAVGRSVRRAKEVGVRKAMGAQRAQIRAQFWGEAFLLAGMGLLVGLVGTALLLPIFNTVTGKALSLADGGLLLVLVLAGLLAVTGLVAGSYPALVLSRMRPIEPLRGRIRLRGPGRLTRSLVAVQFTLSIFLIMATLGVARQLDYLVSKDLGYDGDQLVAIPSQGMPGDRLLARFRDELTGAPEVVAVTGLNSSFGRGRSRRGMRHGEVVVEPIAMRVEHGFLEALDMTLVEGRVFDPALATDSTQSVVVNEAFVRELGLSNPVGYRLEGLEWGRVAQPTIIGVVADFHVESLRNEVRPAVLSLDPGSQVRWVLVRLAPDDLPRGLARLESVWQTVAPDVPFDYSFVDEDMAALYAEEERWSRIVRYGAFFAILVACLGLFGLAALAVTARTKEIGVRKVLGASAPSLAALLTRDFVVIVLAALVIATPAAYVTLRRVLADYPYQAGLPWWLFAGAGALALVAALLTVGYQTYRATRANPVEALRYE